MPPEWSHEGKLEGKLKKVLYASEFMKAGDVPEIVITRPTEQNLLNRFVYLAWYRLTDETIARIQRQRPLFE
jgi:hypothetical protein